MARFTRLNVAETMMKQGIVPLFYHPDAEIGKKVLTSCYRGGGRIIEFTNRGDYAHEVFAELNKFCARELPEMILGVGSVTDTGTTALYLQLGANFIVTPVLREDIAIVCNRRKILFAPGCGSLTEIARAEELGCEIVKLFPGSMFGPGFIKDIRGPQPWTSIMPTGGVSPTAESLKEWFDAGAVCVGMGSRLVSPDILKNQNFDVLENRMKETLQIIEKVRNK